MTLKAWVTEQGFGRLEDAAAALGVSVSSLYYYINDLSRPSARVCVKIVAATGGAVSLDELLAIEPNARRAKNATTGARPLGYTQDRLKNA